MGDRRVSEDDGKPLCRPHTKVFSNGYLAAGTCGDFMCVMAVARAVEEGVDQPDYLSDMLNEASEALVLLNGLIYLVGADSVRELTGPVQGCGSGGKAALGYLVGAGGVHTQARVQKAIQCAIVLDSSCGDGIDIVRPE